MSDSVRKSSRATKGQHRKSFEPADTPTAKARGKGKGSKAAKQTSAEPTPAEDDDDSIIRCICGYVVEDEDDDRKMICCDNCTAWQHNECMEVSLDDDELPEQYFCEQCRPDLHQPLLEKVERGERPWEERERKRLQEEEEARLKKKKGKKGKKARASNVKPEVEAEPAKINGAPDLASAVMPPPITTEPESRVESAPKRKLPDDATDEAKSPSQQEPQSKVRKVSASAETKPSIPVPRRKSSNMVPQPSPTKAAPIRRDSKVVPLQMELVEDIADLQSDARQKIAKALVKQFVEKTKEAQKEGVFSLPPSQSVDAFGNKLGLAVEYAIFLNFWGTAAEPNNHYIEKFRTINHNVKHNSALRNRLLTGELSPNDLSKMSTNDMASSDLQEEKAEMKRMAEKQVVLVEQQGPRIRRTHKGEEFVEGPDFQGPALPDTVFSAPVRRPRPSDADIPTQASPEAASPRSPNAVELPEDVGNTVTTSKTTQPLSVDTKAPPGAGVGLEKQSSANFNIQDVWSSVTGPDADTQKPKPVLQHTESGQAVPLPQPAVGSGDADIDRLLKEDDAEEEEPYSPIEYPLDPNVPVWNGRLSMEGVAEFHGIGKHVAGANLNGTIPWNLLMSETINVEGRIDIERATEYLCGLQYSKTTDVSIVAITPTEEEESKIAFEKLFQYFTDRKRYGVIVKKSDAKDVYLVPLDAGTTVKPEFIELLEYCTIQTPVPERMLLVTFVIRSHNAAAAQENNTPRQPDAAAIASPINASGGPAPSPFTAPPPMGYHGSPTPAAYHNSPPQPQGGFQPPQQYSHTPPQQLPYGIPPHQHHQQQQPPPYQPPYNGPVGMEAAKQVLGEMAYAPTVGAMLDEAPTAGVVEFQIVREIYQTVSAAKENYDMLKTMLQMKLREGPPMHG
ncbi:Transcription factor bye1 [Xanthoria parietina]